MNIKKLIVGAAAGILMLGTVVIPVFAKDCANVGKVSNISGFFAYPPGQPGPDYDGYLYTCNSVHRTATATGFQESQSCKLISETRIIEKVLRLNGGYTWISDYVYNTTGECELATSYSIKITPGNVVKIVSYYGLSPLFCSQ